MDKIKRAFSSQQADAQSPLAPGPASAAPPSDSAPSVAVDVPPWMNRGPQHLRYKTVARALAARYYHEDVPPDVLQQTAETEGVDSEAVRRQIEADRRPPEPFVIRRRRIDPDALQVVDLTALESVRMRIKGSAYTMSDTERRRQSGPEYLLIREPDNAVDPSAVAVYGVKGHRVGYLSAARAKMVSPLLAQLGADAFKVAGTGASGGSIVLHVDVPQADALRRFVREATD